ncbi:MAG TPA: hypothetical protein VGB83_07165 [Actinomycetota bacterium]
MSIFVLSLLALGVLTPTELAHAGSLFGKEGVVDIEPMQPLMIDVVSRRLYANVRKGGLSLREYDLDRGFGKMLLREKRLPIRNTAFSNYWITPDWEGRRAFILDYHPPGYATDPECPYCSYVRVLDLDTLSLSDREWNLTQLVPNFFAEGITYSARDKRLYITGSLIGSAAFFMTVASGPVYPTTIVSLDVETGQVAWLRTLTKCLRPMSGYNVGGGIYRSMLRDALFVGCSRADTSALVGAPYPGNTGVARLTFDPDADLASAQSFREEFFQASGSFASVVGTETRTAFDYGSDRFVLISSALTTPGAWVFDGRMSTWVGFIPAADGADMAVGIDARSGHVYLREGNSGRVVLTDGRVTPVPQGNPYRVAPDTTAAPSVTYLVDSTMRRVFIPVYTPDGSELIAVRDDVPAIEPGEPFDYDAITSGVPEGPNTLSTFAGGGSGFGVRALLVGGLGGASSPTRPGLIGQIVRDTVGETGASPGDRGLMLGHVHSIDLRNVGASARAQVLGIDDLTNNDRGNVQREIARAGGEDEDPEEQTPQEQAAAFADWPWPASECLDAEGTPLEEENSGPLGRAAVDCDLERAEVEASAQAAVPATTGLSVSDTRSTGWVKRSVENGIVAELTATVKGFELQIPNLGSLEIGKIKQTVTTTAHGVPGSAEVDWKRMIKDLSISDASGDAVFSCAASCDPEAISDALNEVFGLRIRMTVPKPEVIESRGGAFAGIREEYRQYVNDLVMNNDTSREIAAVQFEIYNDWADKSRMLIQLAGLQVSSTFGVSSLATGGLPNGGAASTLGGFGGTLVGTSPEPFVASGTQPLQGPIIDRVIRGAMLLARSPGAALSVALLWLILGAGVALWLRRGSFALVLTE